MMCCFKISMSFIGVRISSHCLFSNREGLGTSHKVQTKLYKIPKFGVNRPKSKQDTAI